MANKQVWLVEIHHDHGTDSWVCANAALADEVVYRYVKEWWPTEIENIRMPRAKDEAIDSYFSRMAELEREWYEITPSTLIEEECQL